MLLAAAVPARADTASAERIGRATRPEVRSKRCLRVVELFRPTLEKMRGLLLSVLSTAAGYSFHGIPIKGPPFELTTELQVALWLRDEFKDACSKFRGDMRVETAL